MTDQAALPSGAKRPDETDQQWRDRLYHETRAWMESIPRTDRAYDRGDADAYYGRQNATPCIWKDAIGLVIIPYAAMTKEEVAAYHRGFAENPSGQKDWY